MILLHIFCLTENLPGVLDVRFAEKAPAEKRCLLSWEQVWRYFNITENILKDDVGIFILGVFFLCVPQKNNCALPEDLRDFYLTTDGFMLAWNSKLESEDPETCTDRIKPITVWIYHNDTLNLALLYCFFTSVCDHIITHAHHYLIPYYGYAFILKNDICFVSYR